MHLRNESENYCASVVEVKATFPLEGLDNLVGASFFGFTALVPKTTKVGDVGVVFTAETQLSHDFCRENNLYRHSQYNVDPEQKGYIGDNRRVKALRLRGNVSSALFLPMDCILPFTDRDLPIGTTFTHVETRRYVANMWLRWLADRNRSKGRRVSRRNTSRRCSLSTLIRHITPEIII